MNATVTTRGPYRRREMHYHHRKQPFSPQLKAMQKYNSGVNEHSDRFKCFTGFGEQEDLILVCNVIDHPIIG